MSSLKNNTLKKKSKTPLVDVKQNSEKANTLYKELCRNTDDKTFAELYFSITKRSIAYDEESDTTFIFNKATTLWEKIGKKSFKTFYCEEMSEFFNSKLQEIKENATFDEELLKRVKKIEDLTKLVRKISSITAQIEFVLPLFENKEIVNKMDTDTDLFSFKNGVIDLKIGEFRKRVETDYITRYLNYDYTTERNETVIKEINKVIHSICNDSEELTESIKKWFGYCLTGETSAQCFMFFIGVLASNGKSTLLDMYSKSFPIYEVELKNDTFCVDNATYHKQMNAMNKKRVFRLEEMIAGKMLDRERIKKISGGGNDTGDVMYGNTITQKITGKLNFISNSLPHFEADNGMLRRIRVMEHSNKFVDKEDYDQIKNKNNIYVKDAQLEKKFENPAYNLAYFQILLPYAVSFYKNGLLLCNDIIKKGKEFCSQSDLMSEFIENNFSKTNNEEDRIGKEDFIESYKFFNKGKQINWTKLLSDAMRCKLKYEPQLRCDNRKGCFINLKRKIIVETSCDFIDDKSTHVSGLDEGITKTKEDIEPETKLSSKKFVVVKDKKSHDIYDLMCGTRKFLVV